MVNKICLILEPNEFSAEGKKILSAVYDVDTDYCENYRKASQVEVIFCRLKYRIDYEFLEKFENLKYICSGTTGLNHIDSNLLTQKNISLISLKNEKEFLKKITATPEHTWALMMSAWRRIPEASTSVADGVWDRNMFWATQLQGKRVGIIGFGRVGKKLATYCGAFDMIVTYYDPNVFDQNFTKEKNVEDVFLYSDIIFLAASYSEEYHHFIHKEHFQKMRSNSMFVNTSRGELIDEIGLVEVLKNRQDILVCLDVIENEAGVISGEFISPLICYLKGGAKNLMITPHVAGACLDSLHNVEEHCVNLLLERLNKS